MDRTIPDNRNEFSAVITIGCILGFLGLSIIAATQLTALVPLLFAPLVCGTLGFLLYKSQASNKRISIMASATPVTQN
jgi:hypothetical protein